MKHNLANRSELSLFAAFKTKTLTKFHKQLILLSAGVFALLWLVHFLLKIEITAWTFGAYFFFLFITFFLNWMAERALNRSHAMFINFVYGTTLIRFIFSIFFIVIYLIINGVAERSFIFSFVFLYLFFTTFEIFHLVSKLRAEK